MIVRPRSLISNSLGSVLASGGLIFSTVLIPAILARALTRADYDAYAIVLATLPLLLILPQSMRSVGAAQLALVAAKMGLGPAIHGFRRYTNVMSIVHIFIAVAGIEIYLYTAHRHISSTFLRLGMYSVLVYTLGLMAIGMSIASSAAQRNFLPDNITKLWPGIFQLLGAILIIYMPGWSRVYILFAFLATSSWSAYLVFAFLTGQRVRLAVRSEDRTVGQAEYSKGLAGVLWWNVTAYLATSASVMIVAVYFPAQIVPFSIASSLLGILSAGLIAITGPISVHAATMDGDADQKRRFFLLVNSLFQCCIVAAAVVIVVLPVDLYALWLNASLAHDVKQFSLELLPAITMRLLTMAFTVFVMSASRQHSLWLSPMVESIVAIVGSAILGYAIGVNGVALALNLSAAVRLLITVVYDERRNREALSLKSGDILLSACRLARGSR